MKSESHRLTTHKAFSVLRDMEGALPLSNSQDDVADAAAGNADRHITGTDYLDELEFVTLGLPHPASLGSGSSPRFPLPPVPPQLVYSYATRGENNAPFNHFIDIKKGPGLFDDYDGYSYERGSAHQDQFMLASEEARDPGDKILGFFADLGDVKLDQVANWWLDETHVHAPGQPGYPHPPGKGSPSIEHYSFPQDKGIYSSVETESAARFAGTIPSSVFLPVDNLTRYWFGQFIDTKDPTALGPVMHAIADASIPHHAAGYLGNWHGTYEGDVEKNLENWLNASDFAPGVRDLVEQWSRIDSSPPAFLSYPEDLEKVPAQNWRIDQLVTWLALHAYQAYDQVYQHYKPTRPIPTPIPPPPVRPGPSRPPGLGPVFARYWFDGNSARNLTQLAIAMSVLVLRKALSLPPRSVRRSIPSWLSVLLLEPS